MADFSIYRIGRGLDADIRIDDASVSRFHAELLKTASGLYHMTDCGSLNGTYLARDGSWEPVRQAYIAAGDVIRLGAHQIEAGQLISMIPWSSGTEERKSDRREQERDSRPFTEQKLRRGDDARVVGDED